MANLRVIYDNAADRAILSGVTTAGSLVAANLKNDMKSAVWRTVGTSGTLTVTWPSTEMVGAVVFPYCNLTPTSTIRVRGYTLAADSSPAFDTGAVTGLAAAPLGMWNWGTVPLGANAYAYVGSAIARVWLGNVFSVQKLVIDIVDTSNPSGYIEAARLVAGTYWQAEKNPDYGASISPTDTTNNYRNDAGDLVSDVGTLSNKVSFTLGKMSPSDRNAMWNILRGNGRARPLFISLFAEAADTSFEQMHQVYGKLVTSPAMSQPFFNLASAQLDVEGI